MGSEPSLSSSHHLLYSSVFRMSGPDFYTSVERHVNPLPHTQPLSVGGKGVEHRKKEIELG